MTATERAVYALASSRAQVAAVFDDLDETIGTVAAHDRRYLGAVFDYLGAVVEARFASIQHGLNMTREVIG